MSRSISILVLLGCLSLAACGSSAHSSAPATLPPLVHFPHDQAAHPQAASEWWYVVGHLKSGSRTFGYELTIFKFHNVRPPGIPSPVSIYRTDVAITDEANHRFHHQITYLFPQLAHASSSALDVMAGADSLAGDPVHMQLRASLTGGALDLRLRASRSPMYVGGRGYIPFGNGGSYYYSLTDLAAGGTLRLGGRQYRVSGISWLDHQWGHWSWAAVRGWTWMALQLDNGVQLSVFDFRSTTQRVKAASVSLPHGQRTIRRLSITPTGQWISPHTGGHYPSGWRVRIPSLGTDLRVTPTVRDQELITPELKRGSYWEGSSRVAGTYGGKPVHGLAYVELTGYAGG